MLTKLVLTSLAVLLLPLSTLAAPILQTTIQMKHETNPRTQISIKNSGTDSAENISISFFQQDSFAIASKLEPQQSMQRLIKSASASKHIWAYSIRFTDTAKKAYETWYVIYPWGILSFNKASLFNPELTLWIFFAVGILLLLLRKDTKRVA